MTEHLVFTYGTLKRGYGNNRLLTDSIFVGEAETEYAYYMADHGIPFVWTEGGALHKIAGEVYRVDNETLARLDQLEGHPTSYCRTPILVRVGPDRVLTEASIYFYPHLAGRFGEDSDPAPVVDGRYVWGNGR